jgi:hypothetical protein
MRKRIMPEPIRYESIQEPLDDEERELMNPDTWDWESAEVLPGGGRVSYEVGVLLSGDQYRLATALAEREGATLTELVQGIVLERPDSERLPQDAIVGYAESA